MTQSAQDAAATARGLTDALNRMSERLEQVQADSEARDEVLAQQGRSNRRRINWTIVSVVLDVVLTVALAVVALQAHRATAAAAQAGASNLALCQASNTARHQQIELWDFLLSLSQQPQSARQHKTISEFEVHLHQIFAARNCAALVRQGRV